MTRLQGLSSQHMATHSSVLARRIPWTAEPGGLQSMGSLGVGHDWATSLWFFTFMHWRRKWQPTPVFLPGESHEQRNLVGCCLWGRTESDTTEATWQQQQQGNGTPLQYSCLENPMDGGAWWVAVHGVSRSLGLRHDWETSLSLFTFIHWRRKWQPTPAFLPGESQGQGSLVGCCLWGLTESDTTEAT